ncbi:uncharacterized protein LOC135955262 [Calliphora vicina]|uniref:uncharacterized protein LOC135955262 n=1 Tax=Calliphora vicina TaxID=7373 RepID=UPI00325AE914
MHFLQLFLIASALSLISWASSEAIITREYLPPASSPRFLHTSIYPAYFKPSYHNQYQQHQQYYPQYNTGYYPQYSSGVLGGGHYQQGIGNGLLGGGHYQQGIGSSLGVGGGGYYPNVNLALINGQKPKPKIDVIETVYDDNNGGYVYGKKK